MTTEISTVSFECRDMRHAWYQTGGNVLVQDGSRIRHFRRRTVCSRCGTARSEEFRVSYGRGQHVVAVSLVRRRYEYIPGYQIPGGLAVSEARAKLFGSLEFTHEEG